MKMRCFILCILMATILAAGSAHATLKVVTTVTDLGSIAKYVGGDKVDVTSFVKPNQDPHFVDAKPSYMLIAKDADLFICVGMSLEIGYLQPIIDGSRNAKIRVGALGYLDASVGVRKLEVPTVRITRDLGDVHPQGNPHYLTDPYNACIIAKEIADRLGKLDSANADYYDKRAREFSSEINERMFGAEIVKKLGSGNAWTLLQSGKLKGTLEKRGIKAGGWVGKLLPYQGKEIVTYHRSWPYFADAFNLKVLDELEPKPGVPPSPGHVAKVISEMKKSGAKVVLMEPYYDRKPADRVAQATGAKVVQTPISSDGVGPNDYFNLMDGIVNHVSSALGRP